nr:MAG TPA: hypothetical protein [Caudoviricetes sp.]
MSKWTTYAGITEVTSLPVMERIPLIINKVIPEMTPFIDRIDRNVFGDKETPSWCRLRQVMISLVHSLH